MIGWALRQLAVLGVIAVLLLVVANRLAAPPAEPAPASTVLTVAPQPTRGAQANALVFYANPQGHVLLDAAVNGTTVRFLVDTGATMVALTLRDAAAAGFPRDTLVFSMKTSTANGIARAAPIRLRELRIDQLTVEDVDATVVENLNISLLGQSFLTRLDGYEMRDGVLTLNYW